MDKIVQNTLSPEDTYEVLDAFLTDILNKSGAVLADGALEDLISYNRTLRIALGLPVEVPD